jgi:hypothetical protein
MDAPDMKRLKDAKVKYQNIQYETLVYQLSTTQSLPDETFIYKGIDSAKDIVYTRESVTRFVPISKLMFKRLKVEDTTENGSKDAQWNPLTKSWESTVSVIPWKETPVYPTPNFKFEAPNINCKSFSIVFFAARDLLLISTSTFLSKKSQGTSRSSHSNYRNCSS